MSKTGKIILAGGAVAGAGVGYTAWKYSKMKNVDIFLINVAIPNISLLEAHIRLRLQMKNPTGHDYNFTYPYVVLHYQGVPVASSRNINEMIPLTANSDVIKDIDITISLLSVSLTIPKLISDLKNKRPIVLDAIMRTSVPAFWGLWNIPYERKKTISIKL